MKSLRLGAVLALRSLRSVEAALPLVAGVMLCVFGALFERWLRPIHAVDRALTQLSFGLWLPLTAYSVAQRVCAGERLEFAVRGIARHAGNRRQALLGASLTLSAILAAAGVLFATATVLAAHPWREPGLMKDLLLSGWIGALAGVAYAAWLSLASGLGKRGRRGWFLIFDLIFGSTWGAWAFLPPRAHVRNLLGGAPPLELAQRTSLASLIAISALFLAIAVLRVPD